MATTVQKKASRTIWFMTMVLIPRHDLGRWGTDSIDNPNITLCTPTEHQFYDSVEFQGDDLIQSPDVPETAALSRSTV